MKAIEVALRRLIVQSLGRDSTALPAEIRDALIAEQRKQLGNRATAAYAASMETLLESAYLITLQKIILAPEVWPRVEARFGSKGALKDAFYALNELRNTLAHQRSLDDAGRGKGEQAVRWFEAALQ